MQCRNEIRQECASIAGRQVGADGEDSAALTLLIWFLPLLKASLQAVKGVLPRAIAAS